jgi:hypothetical protein
MQSRQIFSAAILLQLIKALAQMLEFLRYYSVASSAHELSDHL